MKTITIALLAAATITGCTSAAQRPVVDLEPEALYVEVNADAPISVTCTAGLPCGGSAYGEASVLVEGSGYLRVGDVLIPGTVTADASVSVESSGDGPQAAADASMCFETESKLVALIPGFNGSVCFDSDEQSDD